MTDIYGTVAEYKTYHDERGNSYTADDVAIAAALLRGSEYIDGNYRRLFPGMKTGERAQDREWPRKSTINSPVWDENDNLIARNEIPNEVIFATYEAALREQAEPGALSPDVRASDRRKAVAVSGAVSVTYADVQTGDVDAYRLMVSKIDEILAPILTGTSGAFASFAGKGYRI